VAPEVNWVLAQVPSEPSRYRVAIRRQLRRAGAVPHSPGVWALPVGAAFDPGLDRVAELSREGHGTFAFIDAAPRNEASAAVIREAFRAVRVEEWAEFLADCGKFEREIAHETRQQKFTFAELEEEKQSLARLRRWYRDLKKHDVLELPEAQAAEERLRTCAGFLDDCAERVYAAAHGHTPPGAAGPGQGIRATDTPEE